jgi:hypothetical protein
MNALLWVFPVAFPVLGLLHLYVFPRHCAWMSCLPGLYADYLMAVAVTKRPFVSRAEPHEGKAGR